MRKFGLTSTRGVYGTREWFDHEYQRVASDPWGLEWRPSQALRYHAMLDTLTALSRPHDFSPRTILDIGCATGTFTAMLAQAHRAQETQITGIDISALAIQRARLRHPAHSFECLTVEQAEVRYGARFELITMLEVLYYVPEDERLKVLWTVGKMLKPGGVLLVSSMIARHPYMSPERLQRLMAERFAIVDAGVLYLKPLALLEKPLLRTLESVASWRGGDEHSLPERPRIAQQFAILTRRLLGLRAASHSYVVGRRVTQGRDQ